MKKIFTLLTAIVMAFSAWAAAPELYFGKTPVVNGATYRTGYTLEKLNLGIMVMYRYLQDTDLYIGGNAGQKVVIEVKASSPVQVCSIDGTCVEGDNVTKRGEMPDGITSLKIELETPDNVMAGGTPKDPATLMKEITCTVKVYYESSPKDAVEVTVIMTNLPAEEVEAGVVGVVSNNTITLVGNTLEYNVDQPTKLDIYGISGALVMSCKIANTGSVSLDSLHPGIYIYSAAGKSGKIVVRK